MNREYRNKAERAFVNEIKKQGWRPSKRGWPDFFCRNQKTGEVMLVEVKPYKHTNLKRHQQVVCDFLKSKGIKVKVWSPKTGFRDTARND